MKTRFGKKKIAVLLAISSLALLSGCGSSPSAPPAAVPGATTAGGIIGGCIPINTTTMIPFTATSMYMGNPQMGDARVLAGMIPPGDQLATGTYGTIGLTPGGAIPPPNTGYGSLGTFQGQRVDGTTISLTVTSSTVPTAVPQGGYPTTAYPANGQVNATGYIQVSQFIQSLLIQTVTGAVGGGFGSPILNTTPGTYPTGYPAPGVANQQICVSNIAIALQRTNSSFANWLYLGSIYFYLNGVGSYAGGQHGLALNF